jgi:hypothetical protein
MRLRVLVLSTSWALAGAAAAAACSDPRPVHPLDGPEDAGADAIGEAQAEDAATPPPPPVELGRHDVKVVDTRRVVPSAGLPAEANVLVSNNNLDVVRFDGRVWLVWRTAPDHFASTKTLMHVVSSADETTWRFEKTFAVGSDLREPRFLVLGTTLFVYFARLGADPVKFQPQGVSFAKRNADGSWTELADVTRAVPDGDGGGASAPMKGYIAWRVKTERGKPYMTAYLGGEHIYDFDGKPLDVELLTTADGTTWQGVSPAKPVVSRGGGSETDFAIGDDGTLFGVVRNEAGDETGFGSKVCRAPASDLSAWTCKHDPRKYDSPLMFAYDGEVYLVGRRNVTESGNFDLGKPAEDLSQTALQYGIDYRSHPKRCSLWRYVQNEDRIAYVLDLPSKGDTCFASRVAGASPEEWVLYNYSSDIDGPDVSWAEGQVSPTFVYRHVLRFTTR